MLSMPPDEHDLGRAGLIMSWASIVAFMPEPQTLLMVVAPVGVRQAGAARGLARRRLALAGRQHVAHEHLVDPLGRQFGALQRGADRVRAELVGAERRQSPMKRPSGVRAAETMTTGSEAAAMAVLLNCGHRIRLLSSYDAPQKLQPTFP